MGPRKREAQSVSTLASRLTSMVSGDWTRVSTVLIAGHVYRRLTVKGRKVVLRAMNWNDLDKLLTFINGLVDEKQRDRRSELFTGFEHKLTRDEEVNWLASRIVQSENGDSVNIVAEVDGRIVANGQITRSHYRESRHHGELGLTVMGSYRGIGIGREIVKTLLDEARRIGLKSVDVEFLFINKAAIRTYQKAGFIEAGRIPGKVYRNGKFLDSMIMVRRIPRKPSKSRNTSGPG